VQLCREKELSLRADPHDLAGGSCHVARYEDSIFLFSFFFFFEDRICPFLYFFLYLYFVPVFLNDVDVQFWSSRFRRLSRWSGGHVWFLVLCDFCKSVIVYPFAWSLRARLLLIVTLDLFPSRDSKVLRVRPCGASMAFVRCSVTIDVLFLLSLFWIISSFSVLPDVGQTARALSGAWILTILRMIPY